MSTGASADIAVTIGDVNLGPGATAILGTNNVGSDAVTQKKTVQEYKNILFVSEPSSVRAELINTKGSLTEGTCQWILHNESYQSWLGAQDSGLLWISGGPGKGKTMLSIFLTQEWESLPDRVLYVFCGDKSTSEAATIMRSLLYQVLGQAPGMVNHVEDCLGTAERTKHTLAHREDLWATFASMLKDPELGPVLCLIDGLDECQEKSTCWLLNSFRDVFDKESKSKSRFLPPNSFRLAIVSRHIASLKIYPRLDLETKTDAVEKDVARVINAKMKEHVRFSELDDDFITEVKAALRNRSDGTFLWVGFAIQELLSVETKTAMRLALDAIPRDLGALYSKILLRIKGPLREKVAQLLRWVTLACYALSVDQLAEALGGNSQTILDLVTMSGSLLTLSKREYSSEVVVKLIHESVSDFLKCEANNNIVPTPEFRIHVEEMELQITQRCLSRLGAFFCRPLEQYEILFLENFFEYDSFSGYATYFWHRHARQCGERLERLLDSDIAFIQSESGRLVRSRWWRVHESLFYDDLHDESTDISFFHICSAVGLLPLVKRLLQDMALTGNHIDDPDSRGWTALCYALDTEHTAVALLLVDHGASLTRDLYGEDWGGPAKSFKPIHKAMELGAEVAEPFLKKALEGISPNPLTRQPPFRSTALEHNLFRKAVSLGDERLVHILFSNGATMDSDTALLALEEALRQNVSLALMKLILQHCPSTFNLDPIAVFEGDYGVLYSLVKALLGHGMNPNSCTEKCALLHCAVSFGSDLVELLLDYGAHINALDGSGKTALFRALEHGKTEAVAMLLNRGADTTIKDTHGNSTLQVVIKTRRTRCLKLLLQNGLDVTTRDGNGRTALACALSSGDFSTAEVLLEHSAYVDAGDEDCSRGDNSYREPDEDFGLIERSMQPTSFLGAVWNGYVRVVRLFLRHGADVNAKAGSVTLLKTAILNRHVGMVRVLLEHGADTNQKVQAFDRRFFNGRSEWEMTLLDWNQRWDDEERDQIAELLLQRGGVYS